MWKRLDYTKPKTKGSYLVCWSEPYSKEMRITIGRFDGDRFSDRYAGANEILYWREMPKLPKAPKELRTRRCR